MVGAQRLLPGIGVSAALQQVEPLGEPGEDLLRGEDARTGSSQLDRERQAFESAAELSRCLVGLRLGALAEEGDGLVLCERRQRIDTLALEAQRSLDVQSSVRPGTRRGDPTALSRLEHVLEVVEQEQQLLALQVGCERFCNDWPGCSCTPRETAIVTSTSAGSRRLERKAE